MGLSRLVRYPYDWVRFHGGDGLSRVVQHPYYWIKNLPARRRYWKAYAPMIAEDEAFDRTYGTDTSARAKLFGLAIPFDSRTHGVEYACTNERVFTDAITECSLSLEDATFVDLGSGKGKALLLATRFSFQKIVGVEFASELAVIAEANVRQFASATGTSVANIDCLKADALRYEFPLTPLVVFMFNPFDDTVMAPIVDRLRASSIAHPRPLWIIYVNARFRALFDAALWLMPVASSPHYSIWRSEPTK